MICAGINFDLSCISITSVPGPAFHSIGHFPCRWGMGLFCVVYRHNCNRQVFQLKCDSGISHLSKRLSSQVNSSGACTYPAAATVKTWCIILVFPCTNSYFAQIILCSPDKISDDTFISFCLLHKLIRIRTEGLTSKNDSLRIFLQVMTVTLDSIVISCYIHICVSISCLHITWVKSCSCFHKSGTENSGNRIIELTSYCFFLLSIFSCFVCLFIAVNTKAHRT